MRLSTIVALIGLVGCAYGGPGPGERGPGDDGGSFTDDAAAPFTHGDAGGITPHADAGHGLDAGLHASDAGTSSATDAGHTTGVDASTPTAVDAGAPTAVDAGTTGTDGGTPAIDAGPGGLGETCATAVDVSAGGTWMIDTCAMRDDVAAGCGHPGTPDVIIQGVAPRTGSTYQVHVGSDWVIQQLTGSGTCTPMPFSCGAGDWGVSGATFDPYWAWGIEKADGSCGMVSLTVDRVM